MSKPIPPVHTYMTTVPVCIETSAPLTRAQALLKEHGIRHLPVLDSAGALAGLITDRDLRLVMSLNVHAADAVVADVMRTGVYTIEPNTPLDEVAADMAAGKHGSAVVMQNRKVVGIFTTIDVCRALAELLRTRLA
jgi:acetoin utilization protein AcuB